MADQKELTDCTSVPDPPDQHDGDPAFRLSGILQSIIDAPASPGERILIGDFIERFGHRAFGVLLFIFAVPVTLPMAIPGISAVLGVPLLFLSWQLMLGHERPGLPVVLRSRSFRRVDFVRMLQRVLPSVRLVERIVRPRLKPLTNRHGQQVIGLLALLLALIMFLPIPFGNSVPALAIVVLALAVLERDGVAAIVGMLIGVAGFGIVSGVVFALIKGAMFFLHSFFVS